MDSENRRSAAPVGELMINAIDIRNFRCFNKLHIGGCKRINVIVGDNGTGKTALLEAIFFALGATTDLFGRYRQIKGIEGMFRGSPLQYGDMISSDLFHNFDQTQQIEITLHADGPDNRTVTVSRDREGTALSNMARTLPGPSLGLVCVWRDYKGISRVSMPFLNNNGVPAFPGTGEELADFFYFASGVTLSSIEIADRFSTLSRAGEQGPFTAMLSKEYRWLSDLTIESISGNPGVYASVTGIKEKLQIATVSGGINRFAAVAIAAASRKKGIICVDELEGGLYYKHQAKYWEYLIGIARLNNIQFFITAHSLEWIKALVEAAGDRSDDISLWRLERGEHQPSVVQFSGDELRDGIEYGADVRGSQDS